MSHLLIYTQHFCSDILNKWDKKKLIMNSNWLTFIMVSSLCYCTYHGRCTVVAWLARLKRHRVLSLHFFFVHYWFGNLEPGFPVCQNRTRRESAVLPKRVSAVTVNSLTPGTFAANALLDARGRQARVCAILRISKFQANGTHGVAAQNLFGFVWGALGLSPGCLESQPHFRASFPSKFWQLVGKWLILPGSCPWQPKNVVCISWEQSERTYREYNISDVSA